MESSCVWKWYGKSHVLGTWVWNTELFVLDCPPLFLFLSILYLHLDFLSIHSLPCFASLLNLFHSCYLLNCTTVNCFCHGDIRNYGWHVSCVHFGPVYHYSDESTFLFLRVDFHCFVKNYESHHVSEILWVPPKIYESMTRNLHVDFSLPLGFQLFNWMRTFDQSATGFDSLAMITLQYSTPSPLSRQYRVYMDIYLSFMVLEPSEIII